MLQRLASLVANTVLTSKRLLLCSSSQRSRTSTSANSGAGAGDKRGQEKSPRRPSKKSAQSPKRSKTKEMSGDRFGAGAHFVVLNGSPANHVTSLLLGVLIEREGAKENFLAMCDLLHVLADLVMALPSTAAAIHRYKAGNSSPIQNLKHALSGAFDPPKTAVSWFLHNMLVQKRAIDVTEGRDTSVQEVADKVKEVRASEE